MRLLDTFRLPVLAVTAGALLVGNVTGQCPADDTYEDNDLCGIFSIAPAGLTTGLVIHGQANVGGIDDDYWVIQNVPTGQQVTVDALFSHAGGDVDITIYDDAACSIYLAGSASVSDNEQVAAANGTGASKDYYLWVHAFGTVFDCNDYSLQITIAPDPCQQVGLDDSLEENDSCGAAVTLAAGTHTGLFVSTADEDYYRISVAPGDQVLVDQTYGAATAELGIDLYDDPACTNLVTSFSWGGGLNQLSYGNSGAVTTDYYLRAYVVDGSCSNYDLTITLQPDPCLAGLDDSFEDNDDCASAVALPIAAHAGLFVGTSDEDFYAITVAPGDQLTIDQSYVWTTAELNMELFDDPTCTNFLNSAGWGAGFNTLSVSNGGAAAATFYLRVHVVDGDCNNYDLNLSVAPDPCLAPGLDDSFEDNDFCGSGVALAAGAHTGLFIASADLDYYEITVAAGDIVTIDQTYVPGAELYMDLHTDPSCTTFVSSAGWNLGFNTLTWANSTGASATVYLACQIDTFTGNCNNYDLNVSFAPDPCQNPLADDALEDNDDCFTALSMFDGLSAGLFVSKADEDFYRVDVSDGDTLFVDLTFSHATADVDVYIYDDQIVCGDLNSYLVNGFSSSDNENISWTNTSGSLQTYYIQVVVYAFSQGECNNYDMQLSGSGGVLATPFCFGDGSTDVGGGPVGCPCGNLSAVGAGEGCLSSLGVGAILTASGTTIVANDDLVFTVSQARANQPSMLVQGSTLVAFPFKDGILCMGNPTERVEVVFTDASGTGSTSSSIVTNGNVSPGDTRFYQQWFRDPGGVSPCGTGSNFSQGLSLTWM